MRAQNERGLPRSVDVAIASVCLLALVPLLCLTAFAVAITSRGPVLFRHRRAGVGGHPFFLLKFRTMRAGTNGAEVTAHGDARITPVGRLLRRTKIDELPQLWNVIRGEMALVGPRPEALPYVDPADPLWIEVLRVRPGITDPVSIRLRNEENLLADAGAEYESFYRQHLLPVKLRANRAYLQRRTWRTDFGVLLRTIGAVIRPGTTAKSPVQQGGNHAARYRSILPSGSWRRRNRRSGGDPPLGLADDRAESPRVRVRV